MYEYDIDNVDGIDKLRDRMEQASDSEDWSHILSDYIQFGNSKLEKNIAIFNMNSATDCPNIGTDHCQVPKDDCYAYTAENTYPQPLAYRRRQEYLWDCMTADMWAEAFNLMLSRKRNNVDYLRFSEAGDFRSNADIIKVNKIAELVDVDVYTYSASDYLNWNNAENFTVNRSNFKSEYGDKAYTAIPKDVSPEQHEKLSDNAVQCPYEVSDKEISCGTCNLCMEPDAPDVYITLH
jgi:hypothetical protein